MFNIIGIANSVIPQAPKVEQRKHRMNHQEGLKDTKHNEINQEGYVKDMDIPDDKKDEMSMFELYFQEIFENMSGPHPLTEPSTNFPGVYPGSSFASLRTFKMAAADLRLDLIKALSRAQDLGMIKDYKSALIDVGGGKYTYDKLPQQLILKAITYLQKKMENAPQNPKSPQEQQGAQQISQLSDAMSAPMPGFGGEVPLAAATAAAKFMVKQDIPGETSVSMPDQTDNPSVVDQGPIAPTQVKPMKQYDGSYPWIEDGQGKENPHAAFTDDMLFDVQYFWGF